MYTAIQLLENWPLLESSRKSGSHAAGLLLQELEDAINEGLNNEQYLVLKLTFYYGYSQDEIGRHLNKSQRGIGKIVKKSIMALDKTTAIKTGDEVVCTASTKGKT